MGVGVEKIYPYNADSGDISCRCRFRVLKGSLGCCKVTGLDISRFSVYKRGFPYKGEVYAGKKTKSV